MKVEGLETIWYERMLRIARTYCAGLSRDIIHDIFQAYIKDEDVTVLIDRLMDVFALQATEAMVAGHLFGYLRAITAAYEHFERPYALQSLYDRAMQFVTKRLALEPSQVNALKAKYGDYAVRMTSTFSEQLESKAQAAIREVVAQNLHVKEGMELLQKRLGRSINPWTLESIVRTQTRVAYAAGRWEANQEPAIQDILWGYRYVTAGDFRVRPEHEALEGVTLPKDDPMWSQIWPPNGFNCRCDVIEIYKDEEAQQKVKGVPERVMIEGKTVTPGPDAGWNLNFGQIFSSTFTKLGDEMSLIVAKGIEQGGVMTVMDRFGKAHQVVMRWKTTGPPTPSNIAKWRREFTTTIKKPVWMQQIDDIVAKGKTPNWKSPFWSPKRAEYFEIASKRVKGVPVKEFMPVVKPTPFIKHKVKIPAHLRKEMFITTLDSRYEEEVVRAYVKLRTKYMRAQKFSIRVGTVTGENIDAMASTSIKGIILNKSYFGKKAQYDVRRVVENAYKSNFLACKNITEIIEHEYGHFIHKNQGIKMDIGVREIFNKASRASIKKRVSTYATDSDRELFAEAFVKHINKCGNAFTKKIVGLANLKKKIPIRLKDFSL